ncbi:MAG TPA: hypothetical protein VGQ39_16105 [Pyrinomonadaceae bacterium]|jgi:hypothetical protein|nr:hypothetical protein [Pyrinomonadaceae bacterium]
MHKANQQRNAFDILPQYFYRRRSSATSEQIEGAWIDPFVSFSEVMIFAFFFLGIL